MLASPQDQHEASLPQKPLAHAHFGTLQCGIESRPLLDWEERERPPVGDIAFENEVDREDQSHGDAEYGPGPVLDGKQHVRRCVAEEVLNLFAYRIGIQLVGKGNALEFVEKWWQPRGHFACEFMQIADDRGEGQKAECRKCAGHGKQQDEDGAALEWPPAAHAEAGRGAHYRREHHGCQRADIEEQKYGSQQPCQVADKRQPECERDVAAQFAASGLSVFHRLINYLSPPRMEPITPPRSAPPAVEPTCRLSTLGRYSLI